MIRRVITGGQTGVDRGAWDAAAGVDMETGGWVPCDFMTERRAEPTLVGFGAVPLESEWTRKPLAAQYRERTRRNIEMATHVLLLTADAESPGSRLTWRLAAEAFKDRFAVPFRTDEDPAFVSSVQAWHGMVARDFVKDCAEKGGVLMVAGTRESKAPGAGAWAAAFLLPIFEEVSAIAGAEEDR